jgi:hypothetical protein
MKTLVLSIGEDGNGKCLWNEALPLSELGTLEVTRASNVEFDAQTQLWEVRLESDPGRVAFSHASRDRCIEWEIETIQNNL